MKPSSLLLLLSGLVLTACTSVPARPNAAPVHTPPPNVEHARPEPASTTERTTPAIATGGTDTFDRERHADDELLVYAKRFGELPAENQKKELAQVAQILSRNKKDTFNRIKAALIYGLPNSRLRDNAKALALLTELQRDKTLEDDVGGLVALMKDVVDERQRLEDNSTKLNQKVRDEQRRADELQQKLDALKNIDKTMIERGQTLPK